MMTAETIGNICLNISFFIYLIIYLPQIKHNQNEENLKELSMGLHLIIIASFALDLVYSLLKPLPWQYQVVSVVALILLSIQHTQLIRLAYKKQHKEKLRILFLAAGVFIAATVGVITFHDVLAVKSTTLTIGYISRSGFLIYMLPQIKQNTKFKSADALSTTYLNMSLFLTSLDLISAWCLNWGWPNQIGTPITLMLTLTLRLQKAYYRKRPQFRMTPFRHYEERSDDAIQRN